jgi:hypothetical protein
MFAKTTTHRSLVRSWFLVFLGFFAFLLLVRKNVPPLCGKHFEAPDVFDLFCGYTRSLRKDAAASFGGNDFSYVTTKGQSKNGQRQAGIEKFF